MRYQVDSAVILKAGVVGAPQSIDTIRLMDARSDHLRIVLWRQVVGNVEHDIADDASN